MPMPVLSYKLASQTGDRVRKLSAKTDAPAVPQPEEADLRLRTTDGWPLAALLARRADPPPHVPVRDQEVAVHLRAKFADVEQPAITEESRLHRGTVEVY